MRPTAAASEDPEAPHVPQVAVRVSSRDARSSHTSAENPGLRRITSLSLRSVCSALLEPEHKIGPPPTVWRSIRAIVLASRMNLFLVFIPISWTVYLSYSSESTHSNLFTFLAMIPLANLRAFATGDLSMRVGQTLAELINATAGNAVELVVAIIAMTKGQQSIVQSSLVGSVLSNLLLVLGTCFFAGGLRFSEQALGPNMFQLNSSLLTVGAASVLLPRVFHFTAATFNASTQSAIDSVVLNTSHAVAIILIFTTNQLFLRSALYDDKQLGLPVSKKYERPPLHIRRRRNALLPESTDGILVTPPINAHPESAEDAREDMESGSTGEEDEECTPQMCVSVCLGLLAVVTVFVTVTAEFLINSIDGLTAQGRINKEFAVVVLVPIVCNAPEHVNAVRVSVMDKLTLSGAIGSSIQIVLFIIPSLVTFGWITSRPLTLLFDPVETIALFAAVLMAIYCVPRTRSNWMEGMVLICLYLIFATSFWFYPGSL
ncbi:hypothetical protein BV22DRAFT_1130817 [Leucogyrophana mollusca]|uniref:Uncharacterized protein n=1 Tax=Leucogyrophana mollusca TaxID=85980 RepID=A0ACB8BD63_9AGAM|nr:hypothetical protein BV22DRAFT_1130817 [Leucogyrophana mollusca]